MLGLHLMMISNVFHINFSFICRAITVLHSKNPTMSHVVPVSRAGITSFCLVILTASITRQDEKVLFANVAKCLLRSIHCPCFEGITGKFPDPQKELQIRPALGWDGRHDSTASLRAWQTQWCTVTFLPDEESATIKSNHTHKPAIVGATS